MGTVAIIETPGKRFNFTTKTLRHEACRMQNAECKMQKEATKNMAESHSIILQFAFCNLTFALLSPCLRG
jgi:hypothetical protein